MAYFAKLDENDVVIGIHALNNIELTTSEGIESEAMGKAFFIRWSGCYLKWVQTSYNGTFRKNYAGIGYTYDSARDAFIPPKPYPSWLLDEGTCQWEAPVPYPVDDELYRWDEAAGEWVTP